MEPIILIILLWVVLVAMLGSPTVRGLLRAIFRRPRETSVFVKVDGRRVEVRPTVRVEGRSLEEALRESERRHRQRPPRLPKPRSDELRTEERKDGAQAVTGGESDE